MAHLKAFAAGTCICLVSCGGGGGSSSPPPPPPPVTLSVSPSVATAQNASVIRLAAIVSNDASNSGVSWSVSCSVAQCGSISPTTTPSGVATSYTTPATIAANVNVTVTATSIADKSVFSSATLIPVGYIPGYDVGVDYHAYGTDMNSTAFITIYNQPQVRQTVQSQLQGMADRGATLIHTAVWFVSNPNDLNDPNQGQAWRAHFPISSQEASNLRAYAQDVAAIQGAGGTRLRLTLALLWLGAADYTIGSPTTGLGYDSLPAAQFTAKVQATIDSVLAAISGVICPDGVPVVDSIIFDSTTFGNAGNNIANNNPNAEWWILTQYPYFVSHTLQQGFSPTIVQR